MVEKNFSDRSARQTVERVARLICQETTMEVIRIRRCTVLAYELILSLLDNWNHYIPSRLGGPTHFIYIPRTRFHEVRCKGYLLDSPS